MKKRRSSLLAIFTLLVLATLCLGVVLAAGIVWFIPRQAEADFGPPAPGLSLHQRILLSARLLLKKDDLTRSADPRGADKPFEVELGEPTIKMVQRLQAEGLILNADTFRTYLQYSGLDTTLQAGKYKLSPAMTPVEIAHALQDATPTEVDFSILPGWRIEEIAASLPTSGLNISPQEFLQAAGMRPEGYTFSADLPAQASMEGFLYPDSYTLPRNLNASELIKIFTDNFNAKLTPNLLQGFSKQNLSLYQAVTLASLVQREAVSQDEMPMIASVFINRLAAGMKLDSDPTVQFALGYNQAQQTWWTNPLSLDDLKVNSPYNTYVVAGLPPGPIDNPSLTALQAVAFPAKTPYYYFRSACDGSGKHVFSETFEEHIQNACP